MPIKPYGYQRYQNLGQNRQIASPERTLMPGEDMSFEELDSYRRVMSNYDSTMRQWYETEQGDIYQNLRSAAQMRAVGESEKGLSDCAGGYND